MQYTIEEKVIERAYKKLALDALVIQQGRLAEQKSMFFCKDFLLSTDCMVCVEQTNEYVSSLSMQLLIKMSCYKWYVLVRKGYSIPIIAQ